MIADPTFYYLAVPAILITGIAKGGFCSPLGMLSVPIAALVIDPVTAAAIMLPILVSMDLIGLVVYRGKANRHILTHMLPFAICGVGLGWLLADKMNEEVIRLALGLVALGFVLNYFFLARRPKDGKPGGTVSAAIWGTLTGFTSFIAHAGNPPYQIYALPMRLPPIQFAATMVYFFAITNLVKLIPYFALGQFSRENLTTTLTLLPLAPIGVGIGVLLVRALDQNLFYKLAYGAMLLVSIKLCYDGVLSLF
ncbi:sulfite exporter TauE/SafE family protein [Cohaesibacter sp. CAU 1516]|uniref:sulfite exporter TauE/SafE family protein n=1 Tax=Cohaesibacter sp. CAU 1516 TaxID=2576038 RepID=UPI0010FDA344|nr:sulfite exporter TauE/SafE family protein [Cohaesibacter sp. CAU 1516]TLP43001.1 sulfite exporter TauE/SafE family protein [Cohaesibacter sp. CAU 1516]